MLNTVPSLMHATWRAVCDTRDARTIPRAGSSITSVTFHPIDMTCLRNMLRSSLQRDASERSTCHEGIHIARAHAARARTTARNAALCMLRHMSYQQRHSIWARFRGWAGAKHEMHAHSTNSNTFHKQQHTAMHIQPSMHTHRHVSLTLVPSAALTHASAVGGRCSGSLPPPMTPWASVTAARGF